MSDATPVQINLISPTFFFYSHKTRFAESTLSRSDAYYTRREETVNDAKGLDLTSLDILLREVETGYEVIKPIPVKVERVDNSFVASFVAANVNTSGDTWDEAVINLQSLLTNLFDLLITHRPEELGPAPKRQLSVLQSFIKKTEDAD